MSCDDRPLDVLARLTALAEKAEHYAAEVWFREAWADVVELAGEGVQPFVHELGAIVFKPDAVVCDVIGPALDYLAARGFTPLVAHPVRLDRHVTRWLWLYRFNVASVERVRVHDLVHEAGDSFLVLLRDERAGGRPIPGTVRLTAAKGSSRPERRTGDQLRAHLRNDDRILNFLHTSDEPADLVRELGILLDRPARRRVLTHVLDRAPFTLPANARHSADGPRELKLASALARLQTTFGRSDASSDDEPIARLARAAAAGAEGSLRELWSVLDGHPHVDRWDAVVVGVHAIEYDEPGVEWQTIGDAPVELWAKRSAASATSS